MKRTVKPRIAMFVIYTIFVLFAVIGAFKSNDLSLLNSQNSIFIRNESFEPNLSMHRLDRGEQGIQKYSTQLNREELSHFKTDTLVLFLNKLTDNAYSVELNGIIIGAEGDMKNGQSTLKNSPNHFAFDKKLVQDNNQLVINTYATNKSGLEPDGLYITDSIIGIQQAGKVDFYGIQLIILGIGFLLFSAVLMVFIYFVNKKQEVAFLYCAIATVFFGIYFVDYLKIVYLPSSYLVYKKIFLSAIYVGAWFYILAMSKFMKCFFLKYLTGLTAISFVIMSLIVDDFILYKELYQYWYLALLVNIIIGFIYSVANLKKVRQAFIFVAGFMYLTAFASSAILLEFFNTPFNINSPLVYIIVFSALPLLFGYDELTIKERQLTYEKELRESEFVNSITDSLTGAFNQRFLYSNIEEIASGTILSMIDIDDFKQINDNYSHMVGDFILEKFSDLVSATIRKTDKLFRYGGDEFIVFLNNCDEKEAFLIMEKLRKTIEEHDFIRGNQLIKITISIGIYKPFKYESAEEVLKKVDKELYLSKQKGKNTISIFEEID